MPSSTRTAGCAAQRPWPGRGADRRLGGRVGCLLLAAGCLLLLAGCRQEMADRGRLKPLEPASLLPGDLAPRGPVPGSVARGDLRADAAFQTGLEGKTPVGRLPLPLSRELLQRGRERYEAFCAGCHDRLGSGQGMVVRRGLRPPTSYHSDRLREAPLGYFVDVITHGFGAMQDYAAQIPPADRWAIALYIRALQLSQRATLADVPAAERTRLEQTRPPKSPGAGRERP